MWQKGVEIWANRLDLQPVHGKSDTLLDGIVRHHLNFSGSLV
jgi:hypothetical protein